MKILVAILILCLTSCTSLNELQPDNLSYWKANERVFSLTNAESLVIKSPRREIIKDGEVIGTEPILNANGEPLTFDLWVKDTNAQPPKGILDVVMVIPRAILAGIGIWKGIDGLVDLGKLNRQQEALVIEVPGETDVQVFAPQGPSGNLSRIN